jgi:hypothetical protein
MQKRGKVLRDAHAGAPGLLIVEGRQYQFPLNEMWKSDIPLRPGLPVDLKFGSDGRISRVTAVPTPPPERDPLDGSPPSTKTGVLALLAVVTTGGLSNCVAAGLLLIAWFFLTAVSLDLPLVGKLELTFFQVLGYLNTGNLVPMLEREGNHPTGFYGVFAIVALAGPLVPYFWKDKRACLAGSLPFAFLLLVSFAIRSQLKGSVPAVADASYAGLINAMSLGVGAYVSFCASLYLALRSAKQFCRTKASQPTQLRRSKKAAA